MNISEKLVLLRAVMALLSTHCDTDFLCIVSITHKEGRKNRYFNLHFIDEKLKLIKVQVTYSRTEGLEGGFKSWSLFLLQSSAPHWAFLHVFHAASGSFTQSISASVDQHMKYELSLTHVQAFKNQSIFKCVCNFNFFHVSFLVSLVLLIRKIIFFSSFSTFTEKQLPHL